MDTVLSKKGPSLVLLKDKLRGLLHKAEVDKPVLFGILTKIWSVVSGPVTALLILLKFTPEYQGYYYTFGSILALQVFAELGLGTVIIQFASHEWSRLKMDYEGRITGNEEALSRLRSLANISFKWFFAGGIIMAFGLGVGGYIFFSKSGGSAHVNWALPWFFLCFFSGINICLTPIWSLLEGCNQVSALYAYRFVQGIIASLSLWAAIFSGAKLWSAPIFAASSIICAAIFLKYGYRNFIKGLLFANPSISRIDWRKEILPMQWRIAISWICGYFLFSFFTPVIFRYYGPVIAGQFGMTWSIIVMVSTISNSWVMPKAPRFGMLIAEKKYAELDYLFGRVMKIFAIIIILSAVATWFTIYLLNEIRHPFAARLLPVLPATVFLIAQVIMMSSSPFSVYMRAHKKEPILYVGVCCAVLTALATFILGKYYSVTAIGLGYLAINMVMVPFVFLIWHRCRVEWHKDG